MKTRAIIITVVAAIALAFFALWWSNQETTPPEPIATPTPTPTVAPTPEIPKPAEPTPSPTAVPIPTGMPTVEMKPWEIQIDNLLQNDADEAQTAQQLIRLLPTLPPDGQKEAAEHIINLLSDEQFQTVKHIVLNPRMPQEVLEVLVTDLYNRKDNVKLRTLLEIAQTPGHPFREASMEDLEIFLDENYGSDWQKWNAAVDTYLKEHPEEQTEAVP